MAKNKVCIKSGKCRSTKCDKQSCEQATSTTTESFTVRTAAATDGVTVEPTPTTVVDPAGTIAVGAEKFKKAYDQYTALRELARPLNGLSQAGPLPPHVKISAASIEFVVNDVKWSAEIPNITRIGAVAPLIAEGLYLLLTQMHEELFSLEHVTKGMQKVVESAFNKTGASRVVSIPQSTTVIPANITATSSSVTLTKQ
jgi:hypothetical protein